MSTNAVWSSLHEGLTKKLQPWLKEIENYFGDQLKSVIVYGEMAHRYLPKSGLAIQTVVVCDEMNFDDLTQLGGLVRKKLHRQIAVPLLFEWHRLKLSADVFPIEFYDIKATQKVLWGEDIFGSLVINDQHLRLLCEHEIKGKVIRLRQAYVELAQDDKGLEFLLRDSLSSLLPVFRSLLYLKNVEVDVDSQTMLTHFAKAFDLDERVFFQLYHDVVPGDNKIGRQKSADFLQSYLMQLQSLADKVDQL